MLTSVPFYHSLIRKYTTLFGTIFSDIKIIRQDDNDPTKNQTLKIPLYYSAKEKVLARSQQAPGTLDRDFAVILPMIAFELMEMHYDSSRSLSKYNKVVWQDPNSNTKQQYTPVPYEFTFRVNVYIKNTEDGTKIIEQILPYFTPNLNLTAILIEELNEPVDLPITLQSIQLEDLYDGDFKQRKMFVWNLMFSLKGYLYGPIKEAKLIKFANASIYTATSNNLTQNAKLTVKILDTPGLTANGIPTTNPQESISPLLININDDYGFCVQVEEY